MSDVIAQPPGFFGKVPARGDFLARRVPRAIDAAWEEWLSTLVVKARDGLGSGWPDDWLTAPLWHFTLGSALAPGLGAAGVLVASVDRVGRFFPFTIISAGCAQGQSGPSIDDWARAAEDLILAALDDDFDPENLDRALVELGPPELAQGLAHVAGRWALPLDNDWPAEPVDRLADEARHPPGAEQSAWWCRGSDHVPPTHLRCQGLPSPALSAAMITGSFET